MMQELRTTGWVFCRGCHGWEKIRRTSESVLNVICSNCTTKQVIPLEDIFEEPPIGSYMVIPERWEE